MWGKKSQLTIISIKISTRFLFSTLTAYCLYSLYTRRPVTDRLKVVTPSRNREDVCQPVLTRYDLSSPEAFLT